MSDSESEQPPSLEGHLLVAAPELRDPNFAQAVVVIIHHNAEGAFGLVLTHATNVSVEQVWNKVSESACRTRDSIYRGGPVDGPLMALHADGEVGGNDVLPGIYHSVAAEHLEALITRNVQPARFFVGYSGWGEGQLERELAAGGWLTAPARPEDLFQANEGFWEATLRRIAGQSVLKALGIGEFPHDLSAN